MMSRFRSFDVFGVVLGIGCAAAAALACSGPDPGEITFAEKRGAFDTGSSSGTSGSTGTDAGSGGGDAGGSSGGPADPVFGTTAFAYANPGQTANGAAMQHAGTVEGKNCFDTGCHGATGAAGPQWLIGGTVYTAATGGQTVAQAEVRVVDGTGKELAKAYTDANGNFWLPKGAADLPAGSKVGVRTATKVQRMATTIGGANGGGCNATGCHVKNTMQVYVN